MNKTAGPEVSSSEECERICEVYNYLIHLKNDRVLICDVFKTYQQ